MQPPGKTAKRITNKSVVTAGGSKAKGELCSFIKLRVSIFTAFSSNENCQTRGATRLWSASAVTWRLTSGAGFGRRCFDSIFSNRDNDILSLCFAFSIFASLPLKMSWSSWTETTGMTYSWAQSKKNERERSRKKRRRGRELFPRQLPHLISFTRLNYASFKRPVKCAKSLPLFSCSSFFSVGCHGRYLAWGLVKLTAGYFKRCDCFSPLFVTKPLCSLAASPLAAKLEYKFNSWLCFHVNC